MLYEKQPVSYLFVIFLMTTVCTALCAQELYWTMQREHDVYNIRRRNLDGADSVEVLTESQLGKIDYHAGHEKLYWIGDDNCIVRAGTDGSGIETVDCGLPLSHRAAFALDPDNEKIYFESQGLMRMDLNGGNVESLLADVDVVDIAIDPLEEKVYWVQDVPDSAEGRGIWRANLDGSGAEQVVPGRSVPPCDWYTVGMGIDPAGGKLYWASIEFVQVLYRANLDGSRIEAIARADDILDDYPTFLDLDLQHRKIYWVNNENGDFYRADMNGSNIEFLFSDGVYREYTNVSGLVVVPSSTTEPYRFLRADANADNAHGLADAISILTFLFDDGHAPQCLDAADANDSGKIDLADAIRVLDYLFNESENPPPPFLTCGSDPTPDDLDCAVSTCGP